MKEAMILKRRFLPLWASETMEEMGKLRNNFNTTHQAKKVDLKEGMQKRKGFLKTKIHLEGD
jgi:hypothetical protein